MQTALERQGVDGTSFDAWRERVRAANDARLRDGDYDHLIHYALQSRHFTTLPPIEPALSAKAFVSALPPDARGSASSTGGLDVGETAGATAGANSSANTGTRTGANTGANTEAEALARVPRDAQARLSALAKALAGSAQDARLAHFRDIVGFARGAALDARLRREYVRAMRFLYEKEFVAQRSAQRAAAVASLYQTRGHSSDTEIEAGYGVYVALASVKQLEPDRRIRRVLIVGPGLDLAPRTGLLEEADPQSYQPFAVADALLGQGLSDRATLRIDAADLNPHVARTIERAVRAPALRLVVTSGIADDTRTQMTDDYRAYVTTLGRAIETTPSAAATPRTVAPDRTPRDGALQDRAPQDPAIPDRARPHPTPRADGHLRKVIAIAPDVQAAISARRLDIATERAGDAAYDLVIVTNVLPYLADAELTVALANIAAALAPGGLLIHNEARPLMGAVTAAVGLPGILARTLLIATVPAGRDLYDTVWIHKKT